MPFSLFAAPRPALRLAGPAFCQQLLIPLAAPGHRTQRQTPRGADLSFHSLRHSTVSLLKGPAQFAGDQQIAELGAHRGVGSRMHRRSADCLPPAGFLTRRVVDVDRRRVEVVYYDRRSPRSYRQHRRDVQHDTDRELDLSRDPLLLPLLQKSREVSGTINILQATIYRGDVKTHFTFSAIADNLIVINYLLQAEGTENCDHITFNIIVDDVV